MNNNTLNNRHPLYPFLDSGMSVVSPVQALVSKRSFNFGGGFVESVFTVGKPHFAESVKTNENKDFGDS